MRNMSFALTKDRILNKTKTVTRRHGWIFLKSGDLIQPVEKCMGLKKGERIKKLGTPIRVLDIRQEPLSWISQEDVEREGFGDLPLNKFISMFCREMQCKPWIIITRIEFEYLEGDATE